VMENIKSKKYWNKVKKENNQKAIMISRIHKQEYSLNKQEHDLNILMINLIIYCIFIETNVKGFYQYIYFK
jgi:hypothetical protein